MAKSGKKNINPDVERIIGAQIRMHRIMSNMSQEQLGERLGVTFQQVQKYEKGSNRVSASRLVELAEIFRCEPISLLGSRATPMTATEAHEVQLFQTRSGHMLAAAFCAILDQDERAILVNLARHFATKATAGDGA